jgi:hypothetical protein
VPDSPMPFTRGPVPGTDDQGATSTLSSAGQSLRFVDESNDRHDLLKRHSQMRLLNWHCKCDGKTEIPLN